MRIYTGNNSPIDFCEDCAPCESDATIEFGDGEGPDNRGNCFAYDAEHPNYETDYYTCHICSTVLFDED